MARISTPDWAVVKVDDKFVLRSPAFAPFNDEHSAQVRGLAVPIIEALNGAISVDAWGAGTITEDGLTYRGASGSRNEFRYPMDTVITTERVTTTVADADARLVKLADLARRDPHVARAMSFYRAHTWQGYYSALDEVAFAVGDGEAAIWTAGLASQADIKLLRHTANSFGAVGSQARHAARHSAPPKPMPLAAARDIVRQVLLAWINPQL